MVPVRACLLCPRPLAVVRFKPKGRGLTCKRYTADLMFWYLPVSLRW